MLRTRTKGFTLIELLVVIAIIALLIGILLPALREARRTARLAKGISNQRQMLIANASYGAEFKDRIATFTWKAGSPPPEVTSDPLGFDLTFAGTNLEASRLQMTWIIRKRGDRTLANFPSLGSLALIPHFTYSHLVLQDYLSQNIPDKAVINPEDFHRDAWSSDPHGYDQGLYQPNLNMGSNGGVNARHPYGASYRYVAAAFDNSPMGQRVYPSTNSGGVFVPNPAAFGGRKMADVGYPSQKVFSYDTFGRHFGKFNWTQWQGLPSCRQPVGMFDGSVFVRSNVAAEPRPGDNPPTIGNRGTMDPNNAGENPPITAQIQYTPSAIEPPAPTTTPVGFPYYTFTRSGLRGIDFGGDEIRRNGAAY